VTHFDLHYTTKFWVHHPHHPTATSGIARGLVVMEQDCTVTLHCTMVHKWRGGNCLIAEPIEMVATT